MGRRHVLSILGVGFIAGSLAFTGCGGNGTDVAAGGGGTRTVAGQAVKGPISNAIVTISQLNANGSIGTTLATTTTNATGQFTLNVDATIAPPFVVTVTGGLFRDEATGQTRSLEGTLRNAISTAEAAAGNFTANITPLGEMAFGLALDRIEEGVNLEDALNNADDAIEDVFHIEDIDSIDIADLTDDTPDEAGAAAEFGAILAALSQLAENLTQSTGEDISVEDLLEAIINDLEDGDFDGIGEDGQPVDLGDGDDVLPTDWLTEEFADAEEEFLASEDNNSGLDDDDITSDELIDEETGQLPTEPIIIAVSPSFGPTNGGTEVTIVGLNFQSGAEVLFGVNTAQEVVINDDGTEITCITPSGDAETVDVVVNNPDGLTGRLESAFTYVSTSATEFVANGRALLQQQNVPFARFAFANALLADPTNQEARFFHALTSVAALIEGTTEDGSTVTPPALTDILARFGFGQANDSIFDADPGQLTEPQDANGDTDLGADSPTVEELRDFLVNDVLPALNAAIEDLDGIDSTFTVTISSSDFGTALQDDIQEEGTSIEVDFGDTELLQAMLILLKTKILILASYELNANLDQAIADANADTFDFQQNIIDANNELLTLESTALAITTSNTLGQARQALIDAIVVYNAASEFIRNEADDQTNDLFTFSDPEDPTEEQTEDENDELSFRNFLAQIATAANGQANVSEDPGDLDDTSAPNDENTFDLNLDIFFDGVSLRSFLPTFVTIDGDVSVDADTLDNIGTLNGIVAELTLNDVLDGFGKFAQEAFQFNQQTGQVDVNGVTGPADGQGFTLGPGGTLEISFRRGHGHGPIEGGILGLTGNDLTVTLVGGGTYQVFRHVDGQADQVLVGNGNGTTSFNLPDNTRTGRLTIQSSEQVNNIVIDACQALH